MPVNKKLEDLETREDQKAQPTPHEEPNEKALLSQVLADPDVVSVLRAKQQGMRVVVRVGDEPLGEVPPPIQEPEIPIDEMDNRQLVAFMKRQMGLEVQKAIDEKLKPVSESAAQASDFIRRERQRQVQQDIEATRAKYKDFDDWKPRMVQLANEHPTLGVEKLYLLAKTEAGSPILPNPSLGSERPTAETRREDLRTQRGKDLPPGIKGRNMLLEETLARITVPSEQE